MREHEQKQTERGKPTPDVDRPEKSVRPGEERQARPGHEGGTEQTGTTPGKERTGQQGTGQERTGQTPGRSGQQERDTSTKTNRG